MAQAIEITPRGRPRCHAADNLVMRWARLSGYGINLFLPEQCSFSIRRVSSSQTDLSPNRHRNLSTGWPAFEGFPAQTDSVPITVSTNVLTPHGPIGTVVTTKIGVLLRVCFFSLSLISKTFFAKQTTSMIQTYSWDPPRYSDTRKQWVKMLCWSCVIFFFNGEILTIFQALRFFTLIFDWSNNVSHASSCVGVIRLHIKATKYLSMMGVHCLNWWDNIYKVTGLIR